MWLQAFIFQIYTHTHTDTHTQLLLSTAVTPHKQQEQDFIESQCRNRSAAWCSTPFQTSLYSQAGRAAVCCEASRSTHEQRQGKKNNTAAKMTKISHLIQEKIHLKSTIFSAGCSLPASCLRTLFFFIFVWLSDSLYTLYLPDFNTFSLPTRCLQSYRTLNDGWSAANSLTLSSEGFYVATRHGLT